MEAKLVSTNVRVLIADDAEVVRTHLRLLLGSIEGVEIVGEAASVASTVKFVGEVAPDLVILDIKLPDGTGIEALRSIKADHPETDVIMLTNHANAFYRRACMDAGALYFFDKSKEFTRVIDVVEELVIERRKR